MTINGVYMNPLAECLLHYDQDTIYNAIAAQKLLERGADTSGRMLEADFQQTYAASNPV